MGRFAIRQGIAGSGSRRSAAVACGLALLSGMAAAMADFPPVRVKAATLQYGDWSLSGVESELTGGDLVLRVDSLVGSPQPDLELNDLVLACKSVRDGTGTLCTGGNWSFVLAPKAGGWTLPVEGKTQGLEPANGGWHIASSVSSGVLTAQLISDAVGGRTRTSFRWAVQPLEHVPRIDLLPSQLQWVKTGTSSGELTLEMTEHAALSAHYEVEVQDLGFDSPEGRFAGESLKISASGSVAAGDVVEASISGEILAGDLLLENLYVSFPDRSLHFETQVAARDDQLRFSEIRVSDGKALDLTASAMLDFDKPDAPLDYHIEHLELQFPEAYQRYIESMASAWTLDGLGVTGTVSWSGAADGARASTGTLDVHDLSVVDTERGRFAITGLDAHIAPSATPAGVALPAGEAGAVEAGASSLESRFSWRGLLLRRINLGSGAASVIAQPGQFSLAGPLQLDVLGGSLAIEDLLVSLPPEDAGAGAEPEIRLYAHLDNLDMELLTQALDWPSFGGTVSGRIPGMRLQEGVLAVDGQIEFNVFDGQVLLSGLRIERPFGVLPSLAANLEARELDLEQVTSTFSFGQISGRMSGYVHDLRMLDWKPVAFDAWFGTTGTDRGANGISRQAVRHLTTIGGGGATAALSGPVMKLFNDFSYKRLGLGCTLSNNVCEVRGLDDDDSSVLIMEGAGIPKVMIRAYNRHMDWPTLVGGLREASRGDSIRIGDKK